jgi:cyclophilin family peptidyl-prolyl cis-trans isomerase
MRASTQAATVLLLVALPWGACVGFKASEEANRADRRRVGQLEARALLLLMADGKLFEPFGVQQILDEHPSLRPALATALGRIQDRRALPLLEGLLVDPDPLVRQAAAFGLGLLGDPTATPALLAATLDSDPEAGRLAVEALGRLGAPLARVNGILKGLPEPERYRRLLPALFRYPATEIPPLLEEALQSERREDHRWAVYAAALKASDATVGHLRRHLDDPDPWVQGWAARGLGRSGAGSDLARLRPLLESPHQGAVIEALRAAALLIARGRAAPPEDWRSPLERLFEDPRAGVRLTALETAGYWLLDAELSRELRRKAREGALREREIALAALAYGNDPASAELVNLAATSSESSLRRQAAEAGGRLGMKELLERLWGDPSPAVRLAVLAAELDQGGGADSLVARRGLVDPDVGVRAAALEWLAEFPSAPLEELLLAMRGSEARRLSELRIHGARALAGWAEVEPLERGASIAALESLAEDPDYLVRREAGEALGRLGRPVPPLGAVETGRSFHAYREIALRSPDRRLVEIITPHGSLILQLECGEAVLTCVSFLHLVNQRFYDGLTFHRVIPGSFVQGGDPRGDGWGGPGFSLRDESNRLRFERGVVGIAKSRPDAGGSQFFITLSRQPHLDGEYTALGRVVAGDEILDRIVQGDRMERAIELEELPE